jgi:inhibitor of KinA
MSYPALIRMHETAWLIQWLPGISAVTNAQVHACAKWLRLHSLPGLLQILPAYDSLYVEFDSTGILQNQSSRVTQVEKWLHKCLASGPMELNSNPVDLVRIPVCFDVVLGSDLASIASFAGMDPEEVISLFTGATYHVFMLGFLPGFPYMGTVNEEIAIPRKMQPVNVNAGAVGIAGMQTGIYPVHSPGGWHIIGHTPLKMFDRHSPSVTLLQPGQEVQFYGIDIHTYHQMCSQP